MQPAAAVLVALGFSAGAFAIAFAGTRPAPLSPMEALLVGHWFTEHENCDTFIELHPDRSVEIRQMIMLASPGGATRTIATRTSGVWQLKGADLVTETSAAGDGWWKLRTLVRTHHWPREGTRQRDWRIDRVDDGRLEFVDRGGDAAGVAWSVAAERAPTDPAEIPRAAGFASAAE